MRLSKKSISNYVNFNKDIDLLLEQLSIKYTKREFYPRNFTLSEEFVRSFKRELHRLIVNEKLPKKAALKKICKALIFHV